MITALKIKICLCQSIDNYNTDPGTQANYHDSHNIAFPFDENELELRNVEYCQLKEHLWKPYKSN